MMIRASGSLLQEMEQALLRLDRVAVRQLMQDFASTDTPLSRIEALIVPVLEQIGASWEAGRVSLSQVYMSGRICEELVDSILPSTAASRRDDPPMAICVLEDFHMLGLRIVYSTLRASGYSLANYGRCSLDDLVSRVVADGIRILLISVLMLPAALRIRELIEQLKEVGSCPKVIVGGAPFRFDEQLWREVRADAFGYSAADAAIVLPRMIRAPE